MASSYKYVGGQYIPINDPAVENSDSPTYTKTGGQYIPINPELPSTPETKVATGTPSTGDPETAKRIKALEDALAEEKAARMAAEEKAKLPANPLSAGLSATDIAAQNKTIQDAKDRASSIDVLKSRFASYGLSGLATKIQQLAIDGATDATITLQLQETPEYQQRFSANETRKKNNLQVLSPAEYLNLEDNYRQVLRAYGLNQFDNDQYVSQFIANDISATELSNRVQTAVQRVQNADPGTAKTLRDYYGIGQTDLVGYVLDPAANFQKIQRQVSAAEIGNAARVQGMEPGVATAEQLAAQGITEAQAQKGYSTIADILPGAEKLSQIYGTQPGYGQSDAEQEVFNGLASAQRKRQKLAATEAGTFSGASGTAKGAFSTGYLNKQSSAGQF